MFAEFFSFSCCSVRWTAKHVHDAKHNEGATVQLTDCFSAVSTGRCNFWHCRVTVGFQSSQISSTPLLKSFSVVRINLIVNPEVLASLNMKIVSNLSVYTNNKALSHFLLSEFRRLGDSSVALCCPGGELPSVLFQVLSNCDTSFENILSCFRFLAVCGSEFCPV